MPIEIADNRREEFVKIYDHLHMLQKTENLCPVLEDMTNEDLQIGLRSIIITNANRQDAIVDLFMWWDHKDTPSGDKSFFMYGLVSEKYRRPDPMYALMSATNKTLSEWYTNLMENEILPPEVITIDIDQSARIDLSDMYEISVTPAE